MEVTDAFVSEKLDQTKPKICRFYTKESKFSAIDF
jgi:hypothetical protein